MDRSNPDHAQIWRDKYERACRDYQVDGSEPVLRAFLRILGYAGARLEAEVSHQKELRAESFRPIGEAARRVVADTAGRGGFTSGLPEGWR